MTTDYAQAMGAKTILDDCVFKGYGLWWLRSPENDSEVEARFVMPDGSIQKDNGLVYRTDFGVVPALWIKLKQ